MENDKLISMFLWKSLGIIKTVLKRKEKSKRTETREEGELIFTPLDVK